MSSRKRVGRRNPTRAGEIDKARRVEGYGELRRKRLEDEATRIMAGEQVNVERIGRRHMTEEKVQRLIGRRGKPRPPSKGTSVWNATPSCTSDLLMSARSPVAWKR